MVGRPRTVSDEAILDAAANAIARHGPARLTLAHVASEVGLVPATLLQRFGSKRGLLRAVATRGADVLAPTFARVRRQHVSALAALTAGLVALIEGIDSPATLGNHLAFLQMDLTDPDLRANAARHSQALQSQIRSLLEDAIESGELAAVDSNRLARIVVTAYNGALITWAIDGKGSLPEWLHRSVEDVLAPYRKQ